MPRRFVVALACAVIATRAAAQGVAPAAHSGAFVMRLGADTIIVERFARTCSAYSVEQALRTPQARLFHTHLELTPAGEVSNFMYMQHRIGGPMDAPLLASVTVTVTGDSASLVRKQGDSTFAPRRVALPPGTLPTLPSSYLGYELASMRAVATRQDSMAIHFLGPNGRVSYALERLGADSMLFILDPSTVWRAKIDTQGRILAMHAPRTTFQFTLARVPTADVAAFASRWASVPAIGVLSPLDSVTATVGGATVGVRYSRPSRRGRVVFGDSSVAMEPWGKVWRTGANEATRLTTDRDLVIGGATVPAGSYTLWTLLDRTGWKLIVNKQLLRPDNSGRLLWGTMYDPQHDLARVPMTMTTLSAPVETMTIAIVPRDQGAVLEVSWDTTRASVPIQVK